jgi:hypothetical protein
MSVELKHTAKGKSYWNNTGAYQEEFDRLYNNLVPGMGECSTVHGEMVRAVSRLLYEFCNNGNCNAIDVPTTWEECDHCYGTGYEEEEDCNECDGIGSDDEGDDCAYCDGGKLEKEDCHYCSGGCGEDCEEDPEIVGYYKELIDFLYDHMEDTSYLDALVSFMEDPSNGYGKYTFDAEEMKVYNDLIDSVVYQVLTTKDKSRIAA